MYGSTAKHADDEAPGMEIRAVDLGFASTAASVSSSSSSSLPQRQWHLELHDVSFAADAGEVLFCVGAAGSWGRSLLELLSDRKTIGRRYGRVLYDSKYDRRRGRR